MIGYIYKTTDLSNGKIYIGQHKLEHFNPKYFGSGMIIKKIKKERCKDLTVEVIEWCETISELNYKEKYWIAFFNSRNRDIGYNIAEGGDGCVIGPFTEEHKLKISISNKGKNKGKPSKLKGTKISKEIKQKLSKSHIGKTHTKETKKKISESLKGRTSPMKGKVSPNKGKKLTKHIWLTPEYEIGLLPISHASRYHIDWILIE